MGPQNVSIQVLLAPHLSSSDITGSSSLTNSSQDANMFNPDRSRFGKKVQTGQSKENCTSKAMRTMSRRPINMFKTLLIPGGSAGVSAAYCNEETLSSSFLILDGFLTLFLGQYSPSGRNEYDMRRDASERWGRRVETNVCIGKVAYEYRMAEEKEKSMDFDQSRNSATIVSQTLVKKPLGVDTEQTDSKVINTDSYVPPSHKMVADCLTYQEFDEATSVYEDILLTDQERYGKNDLVCAIDLHNLGVTNLLAGKLDDAMEYFEQSVTQKRECLGENDVAVSDSLVEIGIILYYKDDLEGALQKFKEAHKIVSEDISNSDDSGRIFNNIACVYVAMHDMESASTYLQKALIALKVGLGLNTKAESALLIFALTQSNIGHLKLKLNQPDAIAPLEESLLVLESVLGDDNSTVESVKANIALARKSQEE